MAGHPHLTPGDDPHESRVADVVRPLAEVDDPLALLVGVPFDTTTVGRRGSKEAPAAIRDALSHLLAYHAGYDLDLEGRRIADCGDVQVLHADVDESWRRITEVVEHLSARRRPLIVVGGDHGLSFPVLRGLPGRLGVIVIDAHYDLRPSHHGQAASGVPFRWALERLDGRVAGRNLTHIGIAGWENSAAAARYGREAGIRSFPARDVHRQGLEPILEAAIERALDGTDGVWLSLDIDGVDAAFAPGTNAPTVGGLTSHDALEIAVAVGRLDGALGMDLVEIAPPLDPLGITVELGATALLTFAAAAGARPA